MPIPKHRLLIHKDSALSSEPIQFQKKRKVVFAQQSKSRNFLRHLRLKQKRRFTQADRDRLTRQAPKHYIPKGSFWRFYRIETLVKRKRTQLMLKRKINDRRAGQRMSRAHLLRQCGRSPILLVIRLRSNRDLPTEIKSILEDKLSLYQSGYASILRNTPDLIKDLLKVGPYVTFGEPSKELVRDLVLKRGRIMINQQKQKNKTNNSNNTTDMTLPDVDSDGRVAINSNVLVEETLGHLGLICIEDIIDLFSDNPYDSEEQKSARDREFKIRQMYYERYPSEKMKDEEYIELLKKRSSMKARKELVRMTADFTGNDTFDESAERIQHRPSFVHINESSIQRADPEKLRVFDEVTYAINPFVLESRKMPLRGMKTPYSRRGYWGYRGTKIDQFVEKVI